MHYPHPKKAEVAGTPSVCVASLRILCFVCGIAAALVGGVFARAATPDASRPFDIPAGEASETLRTFAHQAGRQVVFPANDVRDVRTVAVKGSLTDREALERLLTGTPLRADFDEKSGTFAVSRKSAPTAAVRGEGTIQGRVSNPVTNEFVERARLSVEGTTIETFTDSDGFYRLAHVPAGTVAVRAFFTGLGQQTHDVTVQPGETTSLNISLASPRVAKAGEKDDGVVELSKYVVDASREMSGSAIAINEQRFASNVKNVVSTDEFGFVPEANVAEFIKYVPGISIENNGGNGRWISINGVPTEYVPVTINGFNLASTGGDNETNHAVEVDMVSINTLSRIEVSYSPTPDSPGSALAGSVNMVGRSAFERKKPVFNFSTYVMMRDDSRDFNKTPGPYAKPTRKVQPGLDFSYIAPINDRFGFTLTGGASSQYSWEVSSVNTRRGTTTASNGTTFPDPEPDNPYLSTYAVADRPKMTWRNALGGTIDYKLSAYDRVSLSLQWSMFEEQNTNRTLTFNVGKVLPGDFSATYTHGAPGSGSVNSQSIIRNRVNHTIMPTLTWRHDGLIWKADAGLGVSDQYQHYRDIGKGWFRTVNLQKTGVTVAFDDNFYLRPRRITVTDAAGNPVDPYNLSNFTLTNALSAERDSNDVQTTAYVNVGRILEFRTPVALKAGLDWRRSMRDLRANSPTFAFVGADGKANTADDNAGQFLNPDSLARPGPYGFPVIQWLDPIRLWKYYQSNPAVATIDPNATYRSNVGFSKWAQQIISAAYLRGDVQFFHGRMKVVTGVRAEQTNNKAAGPLSDPTRNVQRDAQGKPVIVNAKPVPITTDPLQGSMLTYLDRGARTEKEYLRLFPSVNVSYNLRENLIARAAYYESVGRPDYNQYAGGITLPNTDNGPSPTNRIVVNNPLIKAWQAKSVNLRLEYYFQGVGQVSAGVFRRDISNFFGSTVFSATPEFLAANDLDPATYAGYDVSTQQNVSGLVRMEGFDVNYKQALTFLPHWARGVQVFANGTSQRVTGEAAGEFTGYVPLSINWGVSLTRPKWNVRANWNYRGRTRRAEVTGRGIEPGTYAYAQRKLNLDLSGEYYFWRRMALFASLRNVLDQGEDFDNYGPHTPQEFQFRQTTSYGSLWTFGVKGTF